MTTIATDGKTMACDSYCTDDTIHHVEKIFQVSDCAIGVVGNLSQCMELLEFLKTGEKPGEITEAGALVLSKEGIFYYEGSVTPYKIIGPYASAGSGAMAALAAMHLGYSPTEAVQVACKVDPYSGGRIKTVRL